MSGERHRGRLGHRGGWSRPFRRPRKDERGAVAIFTAFVMSILLGVTAIVVDLGMERVTRADLQALVDVVALDLAREITGRTQSTLEPEGSLANPNSAVAHSVNRNGGDLLGENLSIQVDWGSYDNKVWNTATDPPTAVHVTATADTDYSVMPGSGAVEQREAFAVASSSACYRLGTFVAAINSGDSTVLGPLNDLLGVSLTLVGYQGLADAEVTLAELAATSTIGSPTALLTGSVTYSHLISAIIEVLSNKPGSSYSAAISALGSILNASGSVGAINLSDVMHVSPTDQAALEMSLNVLDIVGSARLANGEHFIDVPNINGSVPGVGSQFTGGLYLVSAAELACGKPNSPESVANNSQLEGTLGIEFVNLPSLSIPGFATLLTEKGDGALYVSIADGTGQLVAPPEVHCGDGTASNPHTYSVAVQTTPASYSLSSDLVITGDVKITDLIGIGLTDLLTSLGLSILGTGKYHIRVEVNLTVATASSGGTSVATLSLPPNDVTPFQTGTSVYLDPANIVPRIDAVTIEGQVAPIASSAPLTNKIINELIAANNGFVDKTLFPLIDNINNEFVGPVARMVGLRFGGADVYAVGAVCGQPSLWG
jgi:Flp pilus assembly protein TadG